MYRTIINLCHWKWISAVIFFATLAILFSSTMQIFVKQDKVTRRHKRRRFHSLPVSFRYIYKQRRQMQPSKDLPLPRNSIYSALLTMCQIDSSSLLEISDTSPIAPISFSTPTQWFIFRSTYLARLRILFTLEFRLDTASQVRVKLFSVPCRLEFGIFIDRRGVGGLVDLRGAEGAGGFPLKFFKDFLFFLG